ncbi:hypothetical protein DOM22_17945 [Bdellovibrio sp. ZAP7]|uniref:DUF6624 domain-containing protein n=1 Tax=Bdellovibrio sp. ZAP7 TaxID=2231053 RepID=UPI00115B2644|nr:DUF6624 domain-containing protein [Bdellovibrio sp. ZAP7]QDK46902.1 hypothetical protein DOM22_17945 [Bdellovibrio sp. ZAP7]
MATDWKSIGEEIQHMMREDTAVREVLASTGELFQGYAPAMEKVHLKHAQHLKTLIDEHGFPTISKVGKDAAIDAMRLILHAISWPEFMRSMEAVTVNLAKTGEVPKDYVARLMDRIRFYEGRKQIYGTNADWDDNGIMRITDVEDESKLNARRAEMDLPPLESLVITPLDGDFHPADPKKRHEEYVAWTLKVGWRTVAMP